MILGVEQYGQVARETAETMDCFEKIDVLDDNSPVALGMLSDYEKLRQEYSFAFVAVGASELRMQWLDKLEQAGFELPVLVHPKGYVSPSAVFGKGTIVPERMKVAGGTVCKRK